MLSVFSYIIKVSCPSVNENEAPARITSSYGGFVACGACISSILPVHSIAQCTSDFKDNISHIFVLLALCRQFREALCKDGIDAVLDGGDERLFLIVAH